MTPNYHPPHDPHRIDAVLASTLDRLAELHEADHANTHPDIPALAEALEYAVDRRALLGLPLDDDAAMEAHDAGIVVAHVIASGDFASGCGMGVPLAVIGPVVAVRLAVTAIALRLDETTHDAAGRLWRAAEVLTGMSAPPSASDGQLAVVLRKINTVDVGRIEPDLLGRPGEDDAAHAARLIEVARERHAFCRVRPMTYDAPHRASIGDAFAALVDVLYEQDNADHSGSLLESPDVGAAVRRMADAITTAGAVVTTVSDRINGRPLADPVASIINFFASAGVTCEVIVDFINPNDYTLRPRISKPSAEQLEKLWTMASGAPVNGVTVQPPASVVARTEGPRKFIIAYPDSRHFALAYAVAGEDD